MVRAGDEKERRGRMQDKGEVVGRRGGWRERERDGEIQSWPGGG